MDDALRNAAVFGALALACGSFGWSRRWGWLAGGAIALCAVVVAIALGVLQPGAPAVLLSAWPSELLLVLCGWGALGLGIWLLGGPAGLRCPSGLAAFVGGAAFGALPVALGLGLGRPPRSAARLALLAMAGGLCGPLGNEALLLLYEPSLLAMLWPLGVVVGLVALPASPGGGPASHREKRVKNPCGPVLLGAAPLVWALAVLVSPGVGLAAGLLVVYGSVVWCRLRGHVLNAAPDWRVLSWLVSVSICVLLLVPAGVLDLLTSELDGMGTLLGDLLEPGFGLASVALAALAGALPVGLAASLAAFSDPPVFGSELRAVVVAGAAIGAVVPALAALGPGVLRVASPRWALTLLVLLAWLGLLVSGCPLSVG